MYLIIIFYFKNRNRVKVIYTWYGTYFAIYKILFFYSQVQSSYHKFINTNHDSNRTLYLNVYGYIN